MRLPSSLTIKTQPKVAHLLAGQARICTCVYEAGNHTLFLETGKPQQNGEHLRRGEWVGSKLAKPSYGQSKKCHPSSQIETWLSEDRQGAPESWFLFASHPEPAACPQPSSPFLCIPPPHVLCVLPLERKDAMAICPRMPTETAVNYILSYKEEKTQR